MDEKNSQPLSPTVARVLDEYRDTLHADNDFDDEIANRLDNLLRKGEVPKLEDIEKALSLSTDEDQS